jgi:hypothetical protein
MCCASWVVGVGAQLVTLRAQAQSAEASPQALPPPPSPAAPVAPSGVNAPLSTAPSEPPRPPIGVVAYPPPGRHPARALVPVFLSVRAGGRSFIVFDEQQHRVAECDDDCQFWAWPVTYRVQLQRNGREPETSITLRVRHAGSYELSVGDQQVRDGGLALGVVGCVVSVVGVAMMFAGALSEDCTSDASDGERDNCSTPSVVYYGLGTLAVGAGMSAAGFVLFGTNQTGFRFNSEPVLVPITASVGPVPLRHGGLCLGATLSF